MANKKSAAERKKTLVRIICAATAGVLVLSTLVAAVMSQVW